MQKVLFFLNDRCCPFFIHYNIVKKVIQYNIILNNMKTANKSFMGLLSIIINPDVIKARYNSQIIGYTN